MANSNSINLAIRTIEKINSIKQQLRGVADSCSRQLSEVDSLIVNQEKKDILVDGLKGLSVNSNDLDTETNNLQTVCQNILNNVIELTS